MDKLPDTVREMIRIAYLPIVRLQEPIIALSREMAGSIAGRMDEIIHYLQSDHPHREAILKHLYAIFLLDMQNAIERFDTPGTMPKRTEGVFIGFIRLLPEHFERHHDIGFLPTSYISPPPIFRALCGK